MKKLIFSALSLILTVMAFTSCELTPNDLMTDDVKDRRDINTHSFNSI